MTDTVAAPTETASRTGAGESSAGPAVPDHLTPGKFEDPPSAPARGLHGRGLG